MEKNIFINYALKVLEDSKEAMTTKEIWDYGVKKGYDKELKSLGKTPWGSLSAQLYCSGKSSVYFDKIGSRPAKFVLKKYSNNIDVDKLEKKQVITETKLIKESPYKEKDLHPILAYYARNYLNVYVKTINHLTSKRDKYAVWMHPDIVGCYFPFDSWQKETSLLSSQMGCLPVKLFSFELKQILTFSNLREYFFQAVSNSSWANESYIVTAEIESDEQFKDELKRLSSSYGIGVILIDTKDPDNTQIMYPAKEKDVLDWDTINKIAELNKDFKSFISRVTNDIKTQEIREEEFDEIKDREDLILTR